MSATPSLIRPPATSARRTTHFAVSRHMEYMFGRVRGEGVTVSCSSDEVLVKTNRALPVGRKIQLCIDWPAVLNAGSVSIVVTGRVVRSTTEGDVVKMSDYKCLIQSRFRQPAAK